jgi:hypothetical protein
MEITSPHFSHDELCCHGENCCGHQNHCTQTLVDGLDAFRAIALERWQAAYGPSFPFPGVTVHDAYRCLKHNAQVTGAVSDSQHTNGRAADISVHGLTAAELEAIAVQVPAFEQGGIGRDDIRDMIHVDHRPKLARWCYYRDPATLAVKWGPYEPPTTGPVAA